MAWPSRLAAALCASWLFIASSSSGATTSPDPAVASNVFGTFTIELLAADSTDASIDLRLTVDALAAGFESFRFRVSSPGPPGSQVVPSALDASSPCPAPFFTEGGSTWQVGLIAAPPCATAGDHWTASYPTPAPESEFLIELIFSNLATSQFAFEDLSLVFSTVPEPALAAVEALALAAVAIAARPLMARHGHPSRPLGRTRTSSP